MLSMADRDKQTVRQTNKRQTDRQIDRQTDRQTNIPEKNNVLLTFRQNEAHLSKADKTNRQTDKQKHDHFNLNTLYKRRSIWWDVSQLTADETRTSHEWLAITVWHGIKNRCWADFSRQLRMLSTSTGCCCCCCFCISGFKSSLLILIRINGVKNNICLSPL